MLHVMSGISGSGKSTLAAQLQPDARKVMSADAYFVQSDGSYNFNPKELSIAHAMCMKKFLAEIRYHDSEYDKIIIDNTNVTDAEIAPYVRVAQAYNVRCVIHVMLTAKVNECITRNLHGVPPDTVFKQLKNIRAMMQESCGMPLLADPEHYVGRPLTHRLFNVPVIVH